MKTIEKRTQYLEDRELDYFTALSLGWQWARNMCSRSGDSFRESKDPVRWPIGARCVVAPNSAKDLHPTEKNWDGWCIAQMTDPIAPAFLSAVPRFSRSWADLSGRGMGRVIDELGLGFTVNHNKECPPEFKVIAFHPKVHQGYNGPTHLVAACRVIVASKYGPVVTVYEP